MDRTSLLAHFREHGPQKTFLAATCNIVLADGAKCKLLYVFPKFKLSPAEQDPTGMASALKLGLAKSPEEIMAACSPLDTQAYCIHRHMMLRQRFVTVFVTDSGDVRDLHRDWLLNGGWSEHSLFVEALIRKDGFLKPIPQGPEHSRPHKRVKKVSWWCFKGFTLTSFHAL